MSNIKYISTRGKSKILGFKDVIFEGLASDGGLYIPDEWPIMVIRSEYQYLYGFGGINMSLDAYMNDIVHQTRINICWLYVIYHKLHIR